MSRETMSEAARCGNTGPPLTRSTSTEPKEGLAMQATRICSFPECGRPRYSRSDGLCQGHRYQRLHGIELRAIPPRRTACDVPGCDRKHYSRGYCQLHYERLKRNGDPNAVLLIADGRQRFETFYTKTDGCWLWTGSLTLDGYGIFRDNNRRTGAHRFAYEYFVGEIPEGLEIDHLCRVRNCVNPAHLDPVTSLENTLRGNAARSMGHEDYIRWVEERLGA